MENRELIQEYYRHPHGYHVMDDPTIIGHEGNPICGDDLTVYLHIEDDVIVDYSFSGDISMHTQAASSFWLEYFQGSTIAEVLTWTDEVIRKEGFELSTRRRKAGGIALLAVRNAIHNWLEDGEHDTFDDVLT